LAARFVDALGSVPVETLSTAVVELATTAGYDHDDLVGLVSAVEQELQTRFRVAEIKLTTAHELPADALKDLADKVAAVANLNTYSYRHAIDADLLGGFEAQAGDLSFHNSIRARLSALEVRRG
jgi:F0F1-type ATP synthase delta subunit